ncbi:MAG: ELWxxDGT repeat protein [Pirellulales bacterium]
MPALIADLTLGDAIGSLPANYISIGATTYFTARSVDDGTELWKTDGTAAGTQLVRDICASYVSSNPDPLATVGQTLYFAARCEADGERLWRTDGTAAGTVQLSGGFPTIGNAAAVGDLLYFFARDPVTGFDLWKSDGTAGGTVPVADVRPLDDNLALHWLTDVNGTLFFVADDGTHGWELWKSDGTTGGTVMVRDISGAVIGSRPTSLISVGARLFFIADDGNTGSELWTSGGTQAGTVLVKDIYEGVGRGVSSNLVQLNGAVFFVGRDAEHGQELWRSDGSAEGTARVTDLALGAASAFYNIPSQLVAVGNAIYFVGRDALFDVHVYRSDGTAAGTAPILKLGTDQWFSPDVRFLDINGVAHFISGGAIWKTDGTASGTIRLTDFRRLEIGNEEIAAAGEAIVFSGTDASGAVELWSSDGTVGGSALLKDIFLGNNHSNVTTAVSVGGELFFALYTPGNYSFWRTNGTAGGISPIPSTNLQGSYLGSAMAFQGNVYYSVFDDVNDEAILWRITEATGEAARIWSIPSAEPWQEIKNLKVFGEALFFTAHTSHQTSELWKSDGTAGGTVLVRDLGAFSTQNFTDVRGTLYFASGDEESEPFYLWKSDGTAAGTVPLKGGFTEGEDEEGPRQFTAVDGLLYFIAGDPEHGDELWRSDGTPEGTYMVTDINLGGGDGDVSESLVAVGGMLYFGANDGVSGAELWRSDGTAPGTVRVADLVPGGGSSFPGFFTAADGFVYFAATESGYWQKKLWRSDGTAAGTERITDVEVDTDDDEHRYVVINGTLFFASDVPFGAGRLWRSDGTREGTAPVPASATGTVPLSPELFRVVDGRLFFTAEDAAHGRELWVLSPPTGDLDGNFRVDRRDLAILTRNFGIRSGATPEQGDLDGDGKVGLADLAIFRNCYEADQPLPAQSAAANLPATVSDTPPRISAAPNRNAVDAAIVEMTRVSSRTATPLRARRGISGRAVDSPDSVTLLIATDAQRSTATGLRAARSRRA